MPFTHIRLLDYIFAVGRADFNIQYATSATRGLSIKTIQIKLIWWCQEVMWHHGSCCLHFLNNHHCWRKSTWCDFGVKRSWTTLMFLGIPHTDFSLHLMHHLKFSWKLQQQATKRKGTLPWIKLWSSLDLSTVRNIWHNVNTQIYEIYIKGLVPFSMS